MAKPITIEELNKLGRAAFVQLIGPVFEHSPWIAESTWPQRPFNDVADLLGALCATVCEAGNNQKLTLIRAHPDLAGRAALAGQLTRESTQEQASAGLNQLTPEEFHVFQQRNTAYRAKFGFPFVICARLNDKAKILAELSRRLENSPPDEFLTALCEIFDIAELRLRNLILT